MWREEVYVKVDGSEGVGKHSVEDSWYTKYSSTPYNTSAFFNGTLLYTYKMSLYLMKKE